MPSAPGSLFVLYPWKEHFLEGNCLTSLAVEDVAGSKLGEKTLCASNR